MGEPQRMWIKRLAFLALLLLPSLGAAVYFGLLADDLYISEARFMVRDAADQPASGGLAQLAAQARADHAALAVRDYLLSRDAMADVARGVDLRDAWRGRGLDPLPLLAARPSNEALYRRYRQRVDLVVNGDSGIMAVSVQAFRPGDAAAICRQLLLDAGGMIDRLSTPGGHLVMVTIVAPDQPDQPALPQRGRAILTVFGFNLILLAMGWLVSAGLREHAGRG